MNKPKKYYDVVYDKSDSSVVTILLYGVIGDYWDSSEDNPLYALEFAKEFKKLAENHSRINIRINSPGGSIHEGLPIFNTIASCEVETHTYIDGIAYSMAAIIALAGDTVHSSTNGLFLLHNAYSLFIGNAKDLRNYAEQLDKYDSSLITALSSKTGKSVDDLKKNWLNYEDHLLTAEEAKSEGFVDVVEDYISEDIPKNIKKIAPKDLFAYYSDKPSKSTFLGKFIKAAALFNTKQKSNEMNLETAKNLVNNSNLSEDDKKSVIYFLEGIANVENEAKLGNLSANFDKIKALFGDEAGKEDFNIVDALTGIFKENEDLKKEIADLGEANKGKTPVSKAADTMDDDPEPLNSWDNAPWNQKIRKDFPHKFKKEE